MMLGSEGGVLSSDENYNNYITDLPPWYPGDSPHLVVAGSGVGEGAEETWGQGEIAEMQEWDIFVAALSVSDHSGAIAGVIELPET